MIKYFRRKIYRVLVAKDVIQLIFIVLADGVCGVLVNIIDVKEIWGAPAGAALLGGLLLICQLLLGSNRT